MPYRDIEKRRAYHREYACRHKDKISLYYKEQRKNNTPSQVRVRERAKERRAREREIVLNFYGHQCQCKGCDITFSEFLAVDHIKNNGASHRRSIKDGHIHNWLIKNNFPDGFQLLCHNCNAAKEYFGGCPHVKAS